MKEDSRMTTSPLILVQSLNKSMLEALIAMVLIRVPNLTPSHAAGEKELVR